jgi:hypothetical protein
MNAMNKKGNEQMHLIRRFILCRLVVMMVVLHAPLSLIAATDPEDGHVTSLEVLEWKLPSAVQRGQMVQGRVCVASPAGTPLAIQLQVNHGFAWGTMVYAPMSPPAWADKGRWLDFAFKIEPDYPDGLYQVHISPLPGQKIIGQSSCQLQLGKSATTVKLPALSVSGKDKLWQVTLGEPLAGMNKLGVWYFNQDDLLMAACYVSVAQNQTQVTVKLPDTPRWNAAGRGRLQFFVAGQYTDACTVNVAFVPTDTTPFKPMAHGVYMQTSGVGSDWHVQDDHTLIWNGQAWIPKGGMFWTSVLNQFKDNYETRQANWQLDSQALDTINSYGFSDLYVNAAMSLSVPQWLVQSFVDDSGHVWAKRSGNSIRSSRYTASG